MAEDFGMKLCHLLVISSFFASGAANAAETITYTYDAKGRLVKVVRTGTVNNNVQTTYTHDKVNNRKTVVVTGSPNPPPP
jgi:YD repeat-containing protein